MPAGTTGGGNVEFGIVTKHHKLVGPHPQPSFNGSKEGGRGRHSGAGDSDSEPNGGGSNTTPGG